MKLDKKNIKKLGDGLFVVKVDEPIYSPKTKYFKEILSRFRSPKQSFIITDNNIEITEVIEKNRVREAIVSAVLGVNFNGYDENSEKALIKMQSYIYDKLKL